MKNSWMTIVGGSILAAGLPVASAQIVQSPPKAPKAATQKAAASKTPAKTVSPGLVVFKDPVTGEIRQPEASEIGDLVNSSGSFSRSSSASEPQVLAGPGNSSRVILDDSFMSSVSVSKGPDGKLIMDCVEGTKGGPAVSATTKTIMKKEVLDDK